MPHTLSVTVHVDLDLREVDLAVTGCLTAQTHVSLLPIIAQARTLEPAPRIIVDLLEAGHIEPDGLEPLQQLVDLDPDGARTPVTFRIPEPLPLCTRTLKSPPTGWAGGGPDASEPASATAAVRTPLAVAHDGGESAAATAVRAPAPPTAPRRSERPRTRRDEILVGASEMFAEHGYYGASLRDISKHVGMSHPGLLHHFSSKDELLHAVIDRLEEDAQEALDQVEDMCTAPEVLMRSLAAHWHPGSSRIQLLTTLSTEAVSGDHPGRFRMARLRRVHEHVLERCFTALGEQGHLRRGVDPAFAGRAMLGLVLNLAVREQTVRAMQHERHDDAPLRELERLALTFMELGPER